MKAPHFTFCLLISFFVCGVFLKKTTAAPLTKPMPPTQIVTFDSSSFLDIMMEWVTVGDPGNHSSDYYGLVPACGAVQTTFQIGKYDVTAEQYCAFLNAVASVEDTYGLFQENMQDDQCVACIFRKGKPGSWYYRTMEKTEKFPITNIDLYKAMRFCNWMENGQPHGLQDESTTESGSYILQQLIRPDGSLDWSFTPIFLSTYSLPTDDQWCKAAYYCPRQQLFSFSNLITEPSGYWVFPGESDLPPGNSITEQEHQANYKANSFGNIAYCNLKAPYLTPVGIFQQTKSHYGAFDMGGNVFQWTITPYSTDNDCSLFVARGGSWASTGEDLKITTRYGFNPNIARGDVGFRLVKKVDKVESAVIAKSLF